MRLVQKVKSYENGFISNPAVMSPENTVSDLDALKAERNISGEPFSHNNGNSRLMVPREESVACRQRMDDGSLRSKIVFGHIVSLTVHILKLLGYTVGSRFRNCDRSLSWI